MKKIEDYLPLYMGCEITNFPYEKDYPKLKDKMLIGILKGINQYSLKAQIQNRDKLKIDWDELTECGIDQCKLILRPLSDMTEEEAREFIIDIMNMKNNLGSNSFNYKIERGFLSFRSRGWGASDQESTVVIIKNWGNEGEGEWLFNCTYSMNDVIWLLKKGFDLFGLVEEGLAIDKTTLK